MMASHLSGGRRGRRGFATLLRLASAYMIPVSARTGRLAWSSSRIPFCTASTCLDNPLLSNSGLPRFSAIQVHHIEPAVRELLIQLDQGKQLLEAELGADPATNTSIDFASVVEALERLQFPLSYAWGIASHLQGVRNSDELRLVYAQMEVRG